MRLALGPGRSVLILGPTVRVLVNMGSSDESVVSGQRPVAGVAGSASRVVSRGVIQNRVARTSSPKDFPRGGSQTSRFRKGWDEPARAAPPGAGAGSTTG